MSGFHRLHALRMENDEAGFAMDEMRPRFERISNRHENGAVPRAVTAYQLFQTPVSLAHDLVKLLGATRGSRCLEPSAGLGRLLDPLALKEPREIVAVESNSDLCRELFSQNRDGVKILQRDFLTVHDGIFDFIAMNPPFHLRSDIRHIKHALTMLAPSGRMVAICLNERQRKEALLPLCSQWIDLPSCAFKESGTRVETAMVLFTK